MKGKALWLFLLVLFLTPRSNAQSKFVYANDDYNSHPNSVSAFSIGADGSLSLLPGSPFMTGGLGGYGGDNQAHRIAISPDGQFLFASNAGSSNISVFSVDPGSGSLTAVAGSPYATGTGGDHGISLSTSPDGNFLYALSTNSHQFDADYISIFSVTNGSLQRVGPLVHAPLAGLGQGANQDLRVTADGNYVYLSQYGFDASWNPSGRIAIFTRAPDGSLSSPQFFTSNPHSGYRSLETNCSANRLFALDYFAQPPAVDVFSIGAGGALSAIPNSPFAISSDGGGTLYLSPDEARLFVSNNINYPSSVSVFSVSPDGSLGLVPNSPFSVPGGSLLDGLATDVSGHFLYGARAPHYVVGLTINQDGSLAPMAGSPFFTSQNFQSITSLATYPPKRCPTPITVTADSQSKLYGQADPQLTYTVSGLRPGDTAASVFTGAFTRDPGENVGTYNISQGALTADSSYKITFVGATLTINPAPATIVADNSTKILNAPNPTFTWTVRGLVNGDTTSAFSSNPTCTSTGGTNSPVGSYPVTCSGANDPNYSFSYTNGTLQIQYAICVLYDPTRSYVSGSTIPLRIALCDVNNANVSSPNVIVHAVSLTQTSTNASMVIQDSGNANPDNDFRFDTGTYIFNLQTTGYTTGTYVMSITAGGDPSAHGLMFQIR